MFIKYTSTVPFFKLSGFFNGGILHKTKHRNAYTELENTNWKLRPKFENTIEEYKLIIMAGHGDACL